MDKSLMGVSEEPKETIPTYGDLTKKQFHTMMETGYRQARNGQTVSVEETFATIAECI